MWEKERLWFLFFFSWCALKWPYCLFSSFHCLLPPQALDLFTCTAALMHPAQGLQVWHPCNPPSLYPPSLSSSLSLSLKTCSSKWVRGMEPVEELELGPLRDINQVVMLSNSSMYLYQIIVTFFFLTGLTGGNPSPHFLLMEVPTFVILTHQ